MPKYTEASRSPYLESSVDALVPEGPSEVFADEEPKRKSSRGKKRYVSNVNESELFAAKRDWRIDLLGPVAIPNKRLHDMEESLDIPIEKMLDGMECNYIAILFCGDHCPDCRVFLPQVLASASAFEAKRCRIVVCSSDRSQDAYLASRSKLAGLPILPYDPQRARRLRDICGVSTIPALVVFENTNINSYMHPGIICDARNILKTDPTLNSFPWGASKTAKLTTWDRLIVNGKYGKWYDMGYRNICPTHPEQMFLDERNVRIRAGMLNCLSWGALITTIWVDKSPYIQVIFPLVGYEFLASGIFGLTPLAPLGTIATLVGIILHPEPVWKPARPMRFAWAIGLFLSTCCYLSYLFREELGFLYKWVLCSVILICNFFTWLESAAGFCFGCFLYNSMLVPIFGFKRCYACAE